MLAIRILDNEAFGHARKHVGVQVQALRVGVHHVPHGTNGRRMRLDQRHRKTVLPAARLKTQRLFLFGEENGDVGKSGDNNAADDNKCSEDAGTNEGSPSAVSNKGKADELKSALNDVIREADEHAAPVEEKLDAVDGVFARDNELDCGNGDEEVEVEGAVKERKGRSRKTKPLVKRGVVGRRRR